MRTKEELDEICEFSSPISLNMVLLQILSVLLFSFFPGAPLFDSSANFTDPQTLQLLQHSQRLLANLSTIFHCLLNEAQELTQKGVGVCTDITLCSLLLYVKLKITRMTDLFLVTCRVDWTHE